jgi:hypothetical protein
MHDVSLALRRPRERDRLIPLVCIVRRIINVEHSNMTARELYQALKSGPARKGFGFGKRPADRRW